MPPRRRTATSNFGVGRRESHVADAFYARFEAPELSADERVVPHVPGISCVCADARRMDALADDSVALVVTSPPYFAGKQYEEELDREGVPGSYLEYLALLREVFAECKRVLEPGGRIAVNVANLGRKPYRSLAADVMSILQDDLRLLPRGEIIWQKGEGASGSCAWGSFRSAANPVLRDVTERVVVASKGRFGRARSPKERRRDGLPYESSIGADDFMALTLDVWDLPPESAGRVRHPAPFPVELPLRLMELYTYRGDLVVDPFVGSGSTLVAAARSGRDAVGYDTDPAYVSLALERLAAEAPADSPRPPSPTPRAPATVSPPRRSPAPRSKRQGFATCGPTGACAASGWPSTSRESMRRAGRGTSTWQDRTRLSGGAWPGPKWSGGPWAGRTSWPRGTSAPTSCSRRSFPVTAVSRTGRCGPPGRAGSSTPSTSSRRAGRRGSPPTPPAGRARSRAFGPRRT